MKPIIFSTPMVRAILDGRKTQTRRIIPEKIIYDYYDYDDWCNAVIPRNVPCTREYEYSFFKNRARYQPGDILWVRETWAEVSSGIIEYKATYKEPYTGSAEIDHIGNKIKWRPSIHMPREAARIFLKVTNVRVERLHDITENDARNEGVKDPYDYQEPSYYDQPHVRGLEINKSAFAGLWDSLNAKRGYGWESNPWVWVIEFEKNQQGVIEMIEKIYKSKYMTICDNCGTGQECDSWSDVMDFMNYEGWKKKLFDGEWKHFCPECQESEKK